MRIRTIKPEFWTNERIAVLPDFTKLLALALLNYVDDEGYFQANPAIIRGAVFPFMEGSVRIHGALIELSRIDYIQLATDKHGRSYGRIVNFQKHQKINRPTASKIKTCVEFSEGSVRAHGVLSEGSRTEVEVEVEVERDLLSSPSAPISIDQTGTNGTSQDNPPSLPVVESEEATPSIGTPAPSKRSQGQGTKQIHGKTPEDWMAIWNNIASAHGLTVIHKLSPKRIANLNARAKDGMLAQILAIAGEIEASSFLRGTKTDWRVDFDWLFGSANNWIKVVEGKYRDAGQAGALESGFVRLVCSTCGAEKDVEECMLCYETICRCGTKMMRPRKAG
jgi:hypothetical protein